jgi:hypothetical protein
MDKISLIEFYEKYCLIEGKKPVITDNTRWLLENLEKGNIQRVYTRKYGWQYKTIKELKQLNETPRRGSLDDM